MTPAMTPPRPLGGRAGGRVKTARAQRRQLAVTSVEEAAAHSAAGVAIAPEPLPPECWGGRPKAVEVDEIDELDSVVVL